MTTPSKASLIIEMAVGSLAYTLVCFPVSVSSVQTCTRHRVVAHRAIIKRGDSGLDLLQRFLGYLCALDGEGIDAVEVLVIAEATNGIIPDDACFAELLKLLGQLLDRLGIVALG